MKKFIELRTINLRKITWLRNINYIKVGLYRLIVDFNQEILSLFYYEKTERNDFLIYIDSIKFLDYCNDIILLNVKNKSEIRDKEIIIKIIKKLSD